MCSNIYADSEHEQFVHDLSHFGTSYFFTTFGYGLNCKALHMDKTHAFIFSAFTTLVIGMTYKAMENHPTNVGRSMIGNGFGVLGSYITISMFDF